MAAIINAISDAFIVDLALQIYGENYMAIQAISLTADFLIYNASFITLYFLDNRHKHVNADGSRSKHKIKDDAKKLITALGISELRYLSTKFFSTYIVFALINLNPFQISITTTVLSWVVYIITANLVVKRQHFFEQHVLFCHFMAGLNSVGVLAPDASLHLDFR